jgi:hypothetical protein
MAKKALLIGINRYRIPGADLRGCVNDVVNLAGGAGRRCTASRRSDIHDAHRLRGHEGERCRSRDHARWSPAGSKGDVLLLHYSGHGANVPDAERRRGRPARRDPLPAPTSTGRSHAHRRLAARDASTSCSAGVSLTVDDGLLPLGLATPARCFRPTRNQVPRYLPNPWDIMAAESGRKLRGKVAVGSLRRRQPPRSASAVTWRSVEIPEVLMTGCRDTQTSADAYHRRNLTTVR